MKKRRIEAMRRFYIAENQAHYTRNTYIQSGRNFVFFHTSFHEDFSSQLKSDQLLFS